jgi:hypothetical protein
MTSTAKNTAAAPKIDRKFAAAVASRGQSPSIQADLCARRRRRVGRDEPRRPGGSRLRHLRAAT